MGVSAHRPGNALRRWSQTALAFAREACGNLFGGGVRQRAHEAPNGLTYSLQSLDCLRPCRPGRAHYLCNGTLRTRPAMHPEIR